MQSGKILDAEKLAQLGVSDENIVNVYHVGIDTQAGFCEGGGLPVTDGESIMENVNIAQLCVKKENNYATRDHHPNNQPTDQGIGMNESSEEEGEENQKSSELKEIKEIQLANNHVSFATSHHGKGEYNIISLPAYSVKNGRLQRSILDHQQMLWPEHCMQDTSDTYFHPRFDMRHLLKENIIAKGEYEDVDSYGMFFNNANQLDNDFLLKLKKRAEDARKQPILVMDGLAFDYCLFFSCEQAVRMGFTVVVLQDATKSVAPKNDAKTTQKFLDAGVYLTTTAAFQEACKETYKKNCDKYKNLQPLSENKKSYEEWKKYHLAEQAENDQLPDTASVEERRAKQLITELSEKIQIVRNTPGIDLSNDQFHQLCGIRRSLQTRLRQSIEVKEEKGVVIKSDMETGKLDSSEMTTFELISYKAIEQSTMTSEVISTKAIEQPAIVPLTEIADGIVLVHDLLRFLAAEIQRMSQAKYHAERWGSQKLLQLIESRDELKGIGNVADIKDSKNFNQNIQRIAGTIDTTVKKHLGDEKSWSYYIKSNLFNPTSKNHLDRLVQKDKKYSNLYKSKRATK